MDANSFFHQLYMSVSMCLCVRLTVALFTSHLCSPLSAMPFVGDIIGAFMAMTLLHILGRRTSLLLGHILFIVPSVGVVAGLSPDREFYLIILIHMATRYFLVTFPVYFAEVTNHWVRGPLISSRYFLYDTGHILATHAFEKSTMGCLVVVVLQLVSLGISTLLPETPYYLALTGNRDDAEAQYDWLRGGGADPDERENMASRAEMDAEKAAGGMPIGVKTFLMPLMVICCMELGVFGSIPITYYVQTSIEHIHYYRPYVDFDDVVLGVNRFIVREEFIMLTMKLFGIFLVGVLPRRILYLSIALISMLCCTSYMYAGFNPQLIYQVVTAYKFIIFLGSEQLTHVSSAEVSTQRTFICKTCYWQTYETYETYERTARTPSITRTEGDRELLDAKGGKFS